MSDSNTSDIHARVLLVEDNDLVRDLVRTVLEQHGYEVVASGDPNEALALADRPDGPFDLLVTDILLPDVNGHELARRLRAAWPSLRVLFTSGYPDSTRAGGDVLVEGSRFLQKPFTSRELIDAVHELLRG